MFGFTARKKTREQARPIGLRGKAAMLAAAQTAKVAAMPEPDEPRTVSQNQYQNTPDQNMVLVSRCDIWRNVDGFDPVLLVRQGAIVETTQLPKLIRNGVQPDQFEFRMVDALHMPLLPAFKRHTEDRPEAVGHDNPMAPQKQIAAARQRDVLILETGSKSLKRMIDCLFVCGIKLNRIHPVRIPAHLAWSVRKYQPDVLVVDFHIEGAQTGLDLIAGLEALPAQVVLTVDFNHGLSERDADIIRRRCDELGVRILPKPVTRFSLKEILEQSEEDAQTG